MTRRHASLPLFAAGLTAHLVLGKWALATLEPTPATLEGGKAGLLSLALRFNRGVAFSFLRSSPNMALLMSISAILLLAAMHRILTDMRGSIAWPLLYAGAAGNIADRLTYGHVVDWLKVGPLTVNVADILLCLGGVIFILDLLRKR